MGFWDQFSQHLPSVDSSQAPSVMSLLQQRGVDPNGFWGKIALGTEQFAQQLPKDPQQRAQMKLAAIQQAHPNGFFGNIANALSSPAVIDAIKQRGGQQRQTMMTLGQMMPTFNGPTPQPATPIQRPALPSRNLVQMVAPDGTQQAVPQEHVAHYQQHGAQVVNQSSYGGGS